MTDSPLWIPLHVHSQYSVLDAACSAEAIANRAKEFGMPACALTDHGNMHGAIEFYKACTNNGVKPILGCEFYVAPTSRLEKKKGGVANKAAYHLTLLAKNLTGYHNLCRLSSLGYLEGFYYHPRIDKELLSAHKEGLICLSGCMSSLISQTALRGTDEEFIKEVKWHLEIFGDDFYIELQRHKMDEEKIQTFAESHLVENHRSFIEEQEKLNHLLLKASDSLSIPYVATNDSHYLEPPDWEPHEILLNIQSGEPCEIWEKDAAGNNQFRVPNPKRRVYSSKELYFKSPQEMAKLFSDLPEALKNTLEIGQKCEVTLDFETKHYPVYIPASLENTDFTPKQRSEEAAKFLKALCEEGIKKRYTDERLAKVQEKYPDQDPKEVVRERLERELDIIISKGMCDYLLIVFDFINWAKSNDIPVGPGRGSGVGSIVLYLIGITDIEPLRFNLFFERFINPERLSYPDIDVDICMDRRGEVIDYTVRKIGKENVAQIITFGKMKAKMTIKDIGRVLSVPLSKVNQIAKFVPEELNITLEKALSMDPDLNQMYTSDEDAKRIIDFGRKLEGSIRSTGIHAAGVIICGDALTDHIPLCLAKDSEIPATQYSMKPLEAVGMLKMDFLGLTTLTAIKVAVDAIKKSHKTEIDWVNLSLDDKATYRLLQEGKTLGVFQMESGGMQDLASRLHPDRFEEIMTMGALYRPGPMEMIPSFINRKHKKEPIVYDHPKLEPILSETNGIMVYQEQVMQIAQNLAGYSLGEGDVLRKAMGKKEMAKMAKEREKFIKGAIANGIEEETAIIIFDKMEKFASYGFNKSHAAGYGYLTYVTAFLKANYPKQWMAALMTCARDDISKVAKFIRECQALNIPILPPDVNEAEGEFVATNEGIRFAFAGIKGVGKGVVETITEERDKGGPFKDFYDFFKRCDVKRVGKKTIETLVWAGSFDFTKWRRDELACSVDEMFETAVKEKKEAASGVLTFFSLMGEEQQNRFDKPPKIEQLTSKHQILTKERELLGFFLTGHPMHAYAKLLKRLACIPLCELEKLDHNAVQRTAFIVETVITRVSREGQRKFAILTISDGMESYELPVWPDLYEEKSELLVENQLLFAVVQVDKRDESTRFSCRFLADLTKADEAMIAASDAALDKARLRQNRFYKKSSKGKERPAKAAPSTILKLNLDATRLSHILEIKKLLATSKGPSRVNLEFYAHQTLRGVLYLGENQGVTVSAVVKSKLEKMGVQIQESRQ